MVYQVLMCLIYLFLLILLVIDRGTLCGGRFSSFFSICDREFLGAENLR